MKPWIGIAFLLSLFALSCNSKPESAKGQIKYYKKKVHKNPYDVDAHYQLGYAYLKSGLFEAGASQLKDVVRLDKNHAEGHRELGWALYQLKDYKESKKWLKKSLLLKPKDLKTLANLSGVYISTHRFKETVALLSPISHSKFSNVTIHNNLAVAYKNLGDYQSALIELEKAFTLNPDSADSYNNLGILFEIFGMKRNAKDVFKAAIQTNPNHSTAYYNLGAYHSRLKSFSQAIEYFDLAKELNPLDAKIFSGLGFAYKETENYEKSIINYEKSATLDPSNALTRYALGELYDITKKYVEAIDMYHMAINLNPRLVDGYYNLALLYDYNKEGKKALINMSISAKLYKEQNKIIMAENCEKNIDIFLSKYKISRMDLDELLRSKDS